MRVFVCAVIHNKLMCGSNVSFPFPASTCGCIVRAVMYNNCVWTKRKFSVSCIYRCVYNKCVEVAKVFRFLYLHGCICVV